MILAHSSMLIHELLNNNPDIVPEEAPLIIFDSKSVVCIAKNIKGDNHKIYIARRVHFIRNHENFRMHKID